MSNRVINLIKHMWLLGTCMLCVACNGDTLLPNASGAANEVLVVMDDADWRTDGGHTLFDVLTTDVPGLPQAEPMFDISRVPHNQFDQLLRPTRNIVMVYIDSTQYTKATLRLTRNKWARTQAVAVITADNTVSLAQLLQRQQRVLIAFFVDAERERQIDYLKHNINSTALQKVYDKFNIKIAVPSSLNKYNESDDFLWMSNGSGTARQDIVIYSYPYTDQRQLTREALIAKRDSILCQHIPGAFAGSCMGTAVAYEPPSFEAIWVDSAYCAQLRGLWEMKNGAIMGGPFISHTRLDELHNRLITIEGFVFAPGRDKRNLLRQVEAMVYSVQMPQEAMAVTVVASRQ
ncbi:MAG: DUF4837 family protein [Paludibacteraceae bacterium]